MSGTIGLVIVYATVALGVEPQEEAATILRQSGVTGGLLVHVGCGEGELTAALGESESYLVHGLDASLRNVQQARKRLREAGRYGRVSVEQWRGGQLPYMDNIVNLLVLSEPTRVTPAEAMRVLAPRGVLCTRRGEAWVQTVKPQPGNTDDWTHALYNASNNPVAADEAVGPPYHIQWVAEPHHTRHHEHLASISVVVEDAGRLFYIIDEAPTASIFLRPSWALVARDAYNGLLLWKRSIARWESHMLGFRSGPAALSRRLVAVGGRVYVTLGYEAPVTALEAATGETLHTYEDTKGTEEILCAEGLLFMVAKRSGMPNPRRTDEPPSKLIAVLRTDTGELLWRKENLQPLPNTLAVAGGQAFLLDQERGVLSLDAHTGEELWRTARPVAPTRPGWSSPTLLVHDEGVLCADRDLQPLPDLDEQTGKPTARWLADEGASGELTAYKATTGEILWSTRVAETYHSPIDVFVIDGLVWFGRSRSRTFADFTEGRDLQTGEIKRQIATDEAFKTTMPHHRCHRNRATGHYILMGRTGVEFIDVRTGACARHHWTRGVCQYGYIPANGLLYVPPHSCACYIEAKLAGFYAYAPKRADSVPLPPEKRLTRGPAFRSALKDSVSRDDEWPTYRHDGARSGYTPTGVSAELTPWWAADVGDKSTAPVVAEGKVFVAVPETHTLKAFNAETGAPVWEFVAGGRIDSPPTIARGRTMFGCADGHVYSLRTEDGQLAWRFQAAPEERRIIARGQLESVWPIPGSVLVSKDGVYCVAGRSSYLDGGLHL
ncbi:MAG: outer membrane protein assembly factor BamB family protein, partial [Candidatus Zipacnadales bacterium]